LRQIGERCLHRGGQFSPRLERRYGGILRAADAFQLESVGQPASGPPLQPEMGSTIDSALAGAAGSVHHTQRRRRWSGSRSL